MLKLIKPVAYYENICQIDLVALKQGGIKGLLFDLDNTITTWNSPGLKPEVVAWFKSLQQSGIKGCILSNNSAARIEGIAKELGLDFVSKARKPLSSGYKRAMELLGTTKTTTIMVGDQLYTDMLGANLAGIKGFLVKPISLDQEFKGTKINRMLEKPVMKLVLKDLKNK